MGKDIIGNSPKKLRNDIYGEANFLKPEKPRNVAEWPRLSLFGGLETVWTGFVPGNVTKVVLGVQDE
jgi:hypothetical protein